jgi:large subunit ribosomal protein L19
VHCRIVEGDKERIQVFQGTLIARKGRGINEMITVRRIVDGQGVERVFPINSPRVAKFEVVRRADARRSKLYYLRERTGKKRRLRDRRRGMAHVEGMETLQ